MPVLLKGFLHGSDNTTSPVWDLAWLSEAPRGDIVVAYSSDASKAFAHGGNMNDANGTVREFVERLVAGEPVRLDTERIIIADPKTLKQLPLHRLHHVFERGIFHPDLIGLTSSAPISVARGRAVEKTADNARSDFRSDTSNIVVIQLVGSQKVCVCVCFLTDHR